MSVLAIALKPTEWWSAHKACGGLLERVEDRNGKVAGYCPQCCRLPANEDTVLVPVCPNCDKQLPESARRGDRYECPVCEDESIWPPQ